MGTTLARKAWRDLGRRRARAILTSATIALAVAGIGMLAVPTLIDRTMSAEVRETHLYDLTLPVRDMAFDDDTAPRARCHPQRRRGQRAGDVLHSGADRRPSHPGDSVGCRRLHPTVDRRRARHERCRRDGRPGARRRRQRRRRRRRPRRGRPSSPHRRRRICRRRSRCPGVARSLAFRQGPWNHPKQLILYATNDTVRALAGVSGVNSLAFRLDDTEPGAVDATVDAPAHLARHERRARRPHRPARHP